jgi:hypothetical protein
MPGLEDLRKFRSRKLASQYKLVATLAFSILALYLLALWMVISWTFVQLEMILAACVVFFSGLFVVPLVFLFYYWYEYYDASVD